MFKNITLNKVGNLNCVGFIEDSDLLFKIEKIPAGLNLIDYIRFKNTINSTIIGTSIAVFKVVNHLVFLYTHLKNINIKNVLLLKKINFLKQFIKGSITSEIWVINDKRFLCIGIIKGAPIFVRYFNSFYEVSENINMMLTSVDQFQTVESVRFFNTSKNDLDIKRLNIFEYSESLLSEKMNSGTSIEEYVKFHFHNTNLPNKENTFFSLLFLINMGIFFVLLHFKNILQNNIIQKQIELSQIDYKNIPSQKHYFEIQKLKNN